MCTSRTRMVAGIGSFADPTVGREWGAPVPLPPWISWRSLQVLHRNFEEEDRGRGRREDEEEEREPPPPNPGFIIESTN